MPNYTKPSIVVFRRVIRQPFLPTLLPPKHHRLVVLATCVRMSCLIKRLLT